MYFGKSYTSEMQGTIWLPVSCENCKHNFAYEMIIKSWGIGRSPYFLNDSGAKNSAERNALSDYSKKANNAYALVPCPKCGQIHSSMVEKERAKWQAYAIGAAVLFAVYFGVSQLDDMGVLGTILAWIILALVTSQFIPKFSMLHRISSVIVWGLPIYSLLGWYLYGNMDTDQVMPVIFGAVLIPGLFALWRGYYQNFNANLEDNRRKPMRNRVVPIKHKADGTFEAI